MPYVSNDFASLVLPYRRDAHFITFVPSNVPYHSVYSSLNASQYRKIIDEKGVQMSLAKALGEDWIIEVLLLLLLLLILLL